MFKSFELFGVEVYKEKELLYTHNFHTLKEAVKFAKHRDSGEYICNFISCDKYGNKIQDL